MRTIVVVLATTCAAMWLGCSDDGVYVPDEPGELVEVDAGALEAATACAQDLDCDAGAD